MKGFVLQVTRTSKAELFRLTPELRDFIERAIVPILVREYLDMRTREKQIANSTENVALCESVTDPEETVPLG